MVRGRRHSSSGQESSAPTVDPMRHEVSSGQRSWQRASDCSAEQPRHQLKPPPPFPLLPCLADLLSSDVYVIFRSLDLGIFKGVVSVVMADPPWDIRMDLPYGTMTDNEMRNLRVDLIQDEGLLFLWVTGRAMEIARDCMAAWGYRRVDELVWVKTNHLHRIIRTGRTGHWLNHSKVGIAERCGWS